MTGWRAALRLARRDAWRHKANSLLVLFLIALPVLAVTAAAVVWETRDIDSHEALERRMGAGEARVEPIAGATHAGQWFDPQDNSYWGSDDDTSPRLHTLADVRRVLGDVPAAAMAWGDLEVTTDRGRVRADVTEIDLGDPLSEGLFRLVDGRVPADRGEVVVSPALAGLGPGIGETLEATTHAGVTQELSIVGIADSTSRRGAATAVAPRGAFGLSPEETHGRAWLVGGDPVSWDDVRALNRVGMLVTSRAVLTDPPPDSELPAEFAGWDDGMNETVLTLVVLIVVMVLIEVVLLAGPAFAVGARRHARTLALIAANGGTPRQARRVVLASAVVLGGMGAVLGALLGVAVGAGAIPLVQRFDDAWFGPFHVPWLIVAGVCGFGLLSALLAATVPAWIASRQAPVAVLAGRRGDRKPSLRSPLVGLLVLGLGVAGAVKGARATAVESGEVFIAASAILSVLGMIFLVPVVVVAVSRLASRLPLPLRFAARDAARHRTRTVPAVAAVAATVAGVVALGIATSSDEAENRAQYTPTLAHGTGVVNAGGELTDWDAYAGAVRAQAPQVEVREVRGVGMEGAHMVDGQVRMGGTWRGPSGWSSNAGSPVLVAERMPEMLALRSAEDRAAADRMLARGGVVVFSDDGAAEGLGRVRIQTQGGRGPGSRSHRAELPVTAVGFDGWAAPAMLVISPAAADELGVPVTTVALEIGTGLTEAQASAIEETLGGFASDGIRLYVERGYQADAATVIIQLVLGALAAVLMLGGTLTATFLALSDARPDLATLSAVGARPRTRRGVAAAYALVVGLVGSLMGALVGAVPGVAITYPLTGYGWSPDGSIQHHLDVPWGLIAVVVLGLPLLTATIVGLTARSRLPMVARLE